ncbi:ExbD/TolR family protein [Sphingobium nicotianae]|uniref:Biopolymer transporter ExbD n=1 Tax=Sphingobium nicotianae TaxID=2782607 RepID=A0A9X1AI02_9SPHN|nr:biopolymer transporter ExbD [Sphingobium nicotianae]MBT2185427.1 biopolymer transporter ExbD [Sphingobium nicotianae]
MAMSGGKDDGEPMMEMNTTPLIDVMLVLLIMFIITIPIQTHAVKIDLPQNAEQPLNAIDPVKNRLTIDPQGIIYWNGSPVDRVTLAQYLRQTRQMNPEPELQFEPDQSARYVVVDDVLAIIKRSEVTKLGFVGNERYGGVF